MFYNSKSKEISEYQRDYTKERIEEEKNNLEKKYELEYISKRAIMLIYPDGEVESILELPELDGDNCHLNYYTLMYKLSHRLRESVPDFEPYCKDPLNVSHYKVDMDLIKKGTVILLNQVIGVKKEFRRSPLSFFNILLPKNYGSLLQLEKIEKVLMRYPETMLSLSLWNDVAKRCTTVSLSDALEDLSIKKDLIRKEGMRNGKF